MFSGLHSGQENPHGGRSTVRGPCEHSVELGPIVLAFLNIMDRVSCGSCPGQLNSNCFSPSPPQIELLKMLPIDRYSQTGRERSHGTVLEVKQVRHTTDSPTVKFCIYILLSISGLVFFLLW